MNWVQIPAGLGVLITAILGTLKYFGVIPEGQGGKVSTIVNIVVVAVLTIAYEGWGVQLSEDVLAIAEPLGRLLAALTSSYFTHYLSKQMTVYASPARDRRR